jgi:NlpC/P60 family
MRRRLLLPTLLTMALFVVVWVQPISSRATRLALLSLGCIAAVLIVCLPARRRHSAILAAVACVPPMFGILPGRSVDPALLRALSAQEAASYLGVRYVWGGESPLGIDCSGLVRRGLIDTYLHQSVLTLNPGLLRAGVFLWWHDCTARDLGDGHLGFTHHVLSLPSLSAPLPPEVLPGDLAVTADGVHVLLYVGGGSWLQADPSADRVTRVTPPEQNPWLSVPVRIVRWAIPRAA